MKHFKFLTGDRDWATYGGKWYREVSEDIVLPTYHVIELFNWHTDVESTFKYVYNVSLSEVDFMEIPLDTVISAKQSYGMELSNTEEHYKEYGDLPKYPNHWGQTWTKLFSDDMLMLLEAIHDYGTKAPLWNENGNNFKKLLSAAKQRSRELDDPHEHYKAMSQPVNKIGSTALEFMRGDFFSAIIRQKDTPEGKLMLKLHGVNAEEV